MSDEAPNADDELTGPYFDEIRALVNEHRNDLIQRYKERYGVTVPVLTRSTGSRGRAEERVLDGDGLVVDRRARHRFRLSA